jgi:hypothetical protein
MDETFTTVEAAKEIGCTIQYLRLILQRHEHLKPKQTFGGSFVWTRADVEAVKNRNKQRGGRVKKSD